MTEEPNQDDPVGAALNKLAEVIQPLAADPSAFDFCFYLLLLWASFRIYQIEPYVEDDSGKDGSSGGDAKIIPLGNGRYIFDYGYYLCTSPGEDYGNYSTGKLIEAAQQMIDLLAKRGAKLVGFTGHGVAKRAAWIKCLEHNIEVANFYPTDIDWAIRERIMRLHSQEKKKTPAP